MAGEGNLAGPPGPVQPAPSSALTARRILNRVQSDMRRFYCAFGLEDILNPGERRFGIAFFNVLNRASSDSRRSWRGQTTPTNDAYRNGRGLKSRELNPGLWDISQADTPNPAVGQTRRLDTDSEPGSCLNPLEPIHSNGGWLDIGPQTRSRFERPM
jgi:hypothetical protein